MKRKNCKVCNKDNRVVANYCRNCGTAFNDLEKCKYCKKPKGEHNEFNYCEEKGYYSRQDRKFKK